MLAAAFWSPKGGVGKSTLALNVAGDLTYRKYKVVLFDADPQGSALAVARFGNLDFKVIGGPPDRKKISDDVDFVLIDYPPRYETLPKAKRVVVPINPSYVDVAATSAAIKQLKKDRLIIQVANNLSNNLESKDLVEYLGGIQKIVPTINRRTAYSRLMNEGRTVFQKKLSWVAREEIRRLTDTIFEG